MNNVMIVGAALLTTSFANLSNERSANALTFLALFILWMTLFALSIRRTIRWELISTALTIAILAQSTREVTGFIGSAGIGWYDVPTQGRWVIRGILVFSALIAVVAAIRDKPVPAEFIRRRWTDKFVDERGTFDNNRLWVANGESVLHMTKALEEVATVLEGLSLGPTMDRAAYADAASKIRRHMKRAAQMIAPPVGTRVEEAAELQNIQIPPDNLPH